jgi:hypothetical protein
MKEKAPLTAVSIQLSAQNGGFFNPPVLLSKGGEGKFLWFAVKMG